MKDLDSIKEELKKQIKAILPTVIRVRREIHQHPELGFEEVRTSALVAEFLEKLGLKVQKGVGRTGIVAVLEGIRNDSDKTLLLRADMDALPLQEETNLPFKSRIPGKMHACGHDAHTAVLLGVAAILTSLRDYLNGTIKFAFQPAEESSGGALPMIKDGVLENPHVTAALALHVHHNLPTGKIGLKKGYVTASADGFRITLKGPGGHGSAPHQTRDLAMIGVQAFNLLHALPSREIDPLEPVVLTIGKYQVGTRYNIIPEEAVLEGTIRTFNDDVRQYLKRRIIQVISEIAELHHIKADVQFNIGHSGYRPGWNDPGFTEFVGKTIEEIMGKDVIKWEEKPFMGAEDFFEFGLNRKIPTCMFFVGTRNEKKGCTHSLHSAYFQLDEDCIPIAMRAMAATALAYLR